MSIMLPAVEEKAIHQCFPLDEEAVNTYREVSFVGLASNSHLYFYQPAWNNL